MAKIIVIDGQIGPWQFSKQFVREMLKNAKEEVVVKVSSLGGSVDHAIDIHDQLAAHGNVTIEYTGMNASSATILGLGARKVTMSENSFYLIHKPMFWVDVFGTLNEDDIEETIAQLEKQKNDLAKITLVLARMYRDKTGMAIKDILSLMKEEKWLTAEEAKEKGFVDEIFKPAQAVNLLEDADRMAMIAASGYPVPGRSETKPPVITSEETSHDDSLVEKIINRFREIFTPKTNHKPAMKKQFALINKALKVEKLESTDEQGVFLNEEQLQSIETDLGRIATAENARTTAETSLSNATTALDALHPDVAAAADLTAKVEAIKTLLAKKPGSKPAGNKSEKDPETKDDGVDWETLNNLPHMQTEV